MDVLHRTDVADTLAAYGFQPNPRQCEAIGRYVSILMRWNAWISLTRVTKPAEILRFHFGESIFAVNIVPIRRGRLADVGSGAGFPGLAIKIAVPELYLTLIESNSKKATFLAEVVRDLALPCVTILRQRMEEADAPEGTFDFIAARALGSYPSLLKWAGRHLGRSGRVVLWLGEDEVGALTKNEAWNWREPVLIPGAKRRFLLIGSTVA